MSQGLENTLNSANIVGPVASVSGVLYAVATDTWWVGVATMVATAAGVLLNIFKVWRESNNIELSSKLSAAQKEIEDIKISTQSTVEKIVEKNQETIELLTKSYEQSISLTKGEMSQLRDSIYSIHAKLDKEEQ